jgi:hypothetical protein
VAWPWEDLERIWIFLLVKGKPDEDWKRSSEAATLVCAELLMKGKRGIACCSLFSSSESITEKTVVNGRLMTKQCKNKYTHLALYRCWDAWRVSTAVWRGIYAKR